MNTIISGPPANSASVNCQPMSRARITPSSITRLVEAISKAIAAVKFAPLRNSARASATAAYEHEDDAAPSPAAITSVRGRSSPSSRTTVDLRTTAWTTADSANPRISAPGDLPGHRPRDRQGMKQRAHLFPPRLRHPQGPLTHMYPSP